MFRRFLCRLFGHKRSPNTPAYYFVGEALKVFVCARCGGKARKRLW